MKINEEGPQDLVPAYNRVQGPLQCLDVQRPPNTHGIRYVVSGRTGRHLIHQPQLLLAEGEDTGIFRRSLWDCTLPIPFALQEFLLQ